MKLTPRRKNMISGLAALVILASMTTIGIKYSFGYYDAGYELIADFDSAGQGLVADSNVKMRGINVGHVQSIDLIDGQARVVLFIEDGVEIPVDTIAVVRPKTLFGEKFVDLVPGSLEGSASGDELYADGDIMDECTPADLELALEIVPDEVSGCTVSPVELERVLADLYPILQAVDPADLTTILGELATGAEGLGETVNRTLVNSAALLEVQAANDAETRQFLEDLALLTGELADRAPDLVTGAANLNVALPVLTENAESFTALLQQLERLSIDAAELLEGNTAFIDAVYTDGQATLDTLFVNRSLLIPLVIGVGQYTSVVASAARIPAGDGSVLAAVKGIIAGEACLLLLCPQEAAAAGAGAGAFPAVAPADASGASTPALGGVVDGHVSSGTEAVLDLLNVLLGDQG